MVEFKLYVNKEMKIIFQKFFPRNYYYNEYKGQKRRISWLLNDRYGSRLLLFSPTRERDFG